MEKRRITDYIKRVIFTTTYCDYYPLEESESSLALINRDEKLKTELLSILKAELIDLIENEALNLKGQDKCTKKKTYKEKDENGKKTKYKKKKVKWILKQDEKQYKSKAEKCKEKSERMKSIIDNLISGTVTAEDIPLLNETINTHKINTGFYIFSILLVMAALLFFVLFRSW